MVSTNLGPITTSQPIPASCMSEYDTVYKIHTTPEGFYWLQNGPLETSCFPSGYEALSEQYYSPASCPSGFTPACQSTNAIADVTETVHICCPTQYEYSCQDTISYEWESTLGCVDRVSNSAETTWTVVTISDGTTATRISEGLEGGLNAFSIQVRFQDSDFASASSSSSAVESTATVSLSGAPAAKTSGGASNASSGNSDQGTPISTGAVVGIAIGALVGLLLIIGAIVMFARTQRQKRNAIQPMHEMEGDTQHQPQQYVQQHKSYDPPPSELSPETMQPPAEMDGSHPPEPWGQMRYA